MKIGVDIRPLISKPTGVGMWLKGLLESLRGRSEHRFIYFSSSLKDALPESLRTELPDGRFVHRKFPVKLIDYLLLNWLWPNFETLCGEDVDLTLSPTPIYFPTKGKKIITIHDLYFLEHREKAGKFSVYLKNLKKSIEGADLIITVSRYTQSKLLQFFPKAKGKSRVIYEGVRKFPAPRKIENLPEKFLLFIGGCTPRKNLPAAVEISRISGVPLVVVGHCDKYPEGTISIPYASDAQLRYLYETAFALVFPSLDEGFGLPILEAMNFELPVLAYPAGAIPEVGGNAIILCDEVQKFVDAIHKLEDHSFRDETIKKGKERAKKFSWKTAGEEFLKALEEL